MAWAVAEPEFRNIQTFALSIIRRRRQNADRQTKSKRLCDQNRGCEKAETKTEVFAEADRETNQIYAGMAETKMTLNERMLAKALRDISSECDEALKDCTANSWLHNCWLVTIREIADKAITNVGMAQTKC